MKKLFVLLFSAVLVTACTDYDSQFDQVDNQLKELAAANASLEAELAAMAALNASVSAQTAAKLAEFQGAVGAIVQALQALGTASAATIQQVGAIIQAISDLAAQVAANALTAEQIAAKLTEIQSLIDTINTNVLHHSGGGSTDGSGSEHHSGGGSTDDGGSTSDDHHSGGGSTDDGGSEATTTSYLPTYTGVFGGYTVVDNVHTFPAGAEGWAGVANENADIYPLTFDDGGTITFTASSAGDDVGVYFRFERLPYPDVDPAFNTAKATISGSTATEYTINIDAQAAGTTYSSALLYLDTRDVAVTITDITITVPN